MASGSIGAARNFDGGAQTTKIKVVTVRFRTFDWAGGGGAKFSWSSISDCGGGNPQLTQ